MQGDRILKHPNVDLINEMFQNGHSPLEVSNRLKQIQKNKNYQPTPVTLQHYRKNFLQLTRLDINKRREEMKMLGRTRDVTALSTFAASQDFIEAKNQQTEEVQTAIKEFRDIKDEVMSAIKLIKDQTVDAEGKPVFVPRHYEILEKMLGRLESTNNSFIKASIDYNQKSKEAQMSATININQTEKEVEVIKTAVKRILLEIDPNKVSRFFEILAEETASAMPQNGNSPSVKIQLNNSGNETNINIITQLPQESPEDLSKKLKELQNEIL